MVTILKDYNSEQIDAVIISKTTTPSDIEEIISSVKSKFPFYEWDNLIEALPTDCEVLSKHFGSFDELYW